MQLSQLIYDFPIRYSLTGEDRSDDTVSHITNDSRLVKRDSVFVCIRGAISDGHYYAGSAYGKGCRIFVANHPLDLPSDAMVILTENTRAALVTLSVRLYRDPSHELYVVGITGTKGKTSTALMATHVLNTCGIPAGYIGSNGVEYAGKHFETVNTTPECCDIQRYLRDMVNAGIRVCVMEVSSQALKLSRVQGIHFDTCVFTNLSPDHISAHEHPDFEDYKACKSALFRKFRYRYLIYNADDPHAVDVIGKPRAKVTRIAVNRPAELSADGIMLMREEGKLGLRFTLNSPLGEESIELPFPGVFSVYNALSAIAICLRFGLKIRQIAAALRYVVISGRFEVIDLPHGATVIIDYAHNGISLRSALETLRQYDPFRLICVFGSVGGRTQMRRAELGRVAAELADLCILTSDNPDNEPPQDIIRDIAAQFGGEDSCPYLAIPDREKAIAHAVSHSLPGDIILLAGKGHERYQLIAGQHVPFCERDIVTREALRADLLHR